MSEENTINIETLGGKYVSFSIRPDGNLGLAIRYTKAGFNMAGDCVITKDRLEMIAKFINPPPK